MTTVIGLAPNERGAAAVHLGSMLARSTGDDAVVATVVPTPWPPNPYRIDDEYLALQETAAQDALAVARTQIGADLSMESVVHHARSVARDCSRWPGRTGRRRWPWAPRPAA